MKFGPIKFRQWLIPAVVLIGLGLFVDHYYPQEMSPNKSPRISFVTPTADAQVVSPSAETPLAQETLAPAADSDNFQSMLLACQPNLATADLKSPEAYYEHLKKQIGVRKSETDIENYHLRLSNGAEMRVQVLPVDNTNSTSAKEFRVFRLDDEGFPQRVNLQTGDTLERVLAQGQVFNKESRERVELNDGSAMTLEVHNDSIFEFQHVLSGKVFSCHEKSCICN